MNSRIPEAIKDNTITDICGNIDKNSQFMLCGNPDMINDMVVLLGEYGLEKFNVVSKIPEIPKNLINEESLVYERIKWRRKARLEKTSLELLLTYKGEYSYPKKWWREVNYDTRKQISYKNYRKK